MVALHYKAEVAQLDTSLGCPELAIHIYDVRNKRHYDPSNGKHTITNGTTPTNT